jgi:RimJ/RimL family protein N-acetyltransferase
MAETPPQKKSGDRFFLQTRRLAFRIWAKSDLELALGLWGDPQVTRFFDAREKLSPQEVQERLTREIAAQNKEGVQYWPIFLRSSRQHIGCCGLRPYQPRKKIYEIGFHIRTCHWGNGYATEAALGVMQYAFQELTVNGLFAGHNPNNTASRYLLQKLGFRYTHDEYYAPTGLQHPSYILTADEYRHMRAKEEYHPDGH